MLARVLELAARGFAVFPCWPGSKVPMLEHGYRYATMRADALQSIWTRAPDANVAVAPGASGGVVLDLDRKNGKDGLAWRERTGARLPATLTAASPNGGRHLYYRVPPGTEILTKSSALAPGVDVRGTRGSIVAPPSRLALGGAYSWIDDREPAAAPGWLLAALTAPGTRPPPGRT